MAGGTIAPRATARTIKERAIECHSPSHARGRQPGQPALSGQATLSTAMGRLRRVRPRLPLYVIGFCPAIASLPAATTAAVETPCEGPDAASLLCPDLRVGPAADLYVERSGGRYGYGGGALLHAGSALRPRGRGRMERRGRRYKRNWMKANQAIYRVGGGVEVFRTEARLHFYSVGYEWGGSYWKVHDPLSK